jgi:hypothetical protein
VGVPVVVLGAVLELGDALGTALGAALGETLGKLLGVALGDGVVSGESGWSISSINSTDTGLRVGASEKKSSDTGRRVGASERLEMSSVFTHSSKVNNSFNPTDIKGDVSGTAASQKFHTSSGRMLEQSMLKFWASPSPHSTNEQELQASPPMVTSHVSSTPSIKQIL